MGWGSQAIGFYVSGVIDEPVQGAPCHLGYIVCGVLFGPYALVFSAFRQLGVFDLRQGPGDL